MKKKHREGDCGAVNGKIFMIDKSKLFSGEGTKVLIQIFQMFQEV